MKQNNKNIIIIVSEFYPELSELLLNDCSSHLIDNGIKKESISIYKVSGIFEIPGAVSYVSKYHSPDAIIALGVVIKGETPHFDYISKTTFDGLMKLSIENKKPIGNGIITALNKDQASARCGSNEVVRSHGRVYRLDHKKSGKGEEAANAVIAVLSK